MRNEAPQSHTHLPLLSRPSCTRSLGVRIKPTIDLTMASDMIQSYLHSPASIPPDGTVANLENPPKHNTGPLVLLVLCLVLTVVFGVGRAYSRIFVVKNLRVEDCTRILLPRYQPHLVFTNARH